MNNPNEVAIIGAGIAGLSVAIMLRKLGFKVSIYEASDSVRGIGAGIGLASNAIKALEYLGVDKEIIEISNHLQQFEICDNQGKTIFKADTERIKNNYETDNFAIHRSDLHKLLLEKIPGNRIHLNKKLVSLKQEENSVYLKFEDNTSTSVNYLIGADGVNSCVRQQVLPYSLVRFSGYWCWRGTIKHNFENLNQSTEVWGKNGRFGITPLTEQRIYWYACINTNLKDGIQNYRLNELKERFKDYFPMVHEVLKLSNDSDLISTPIVDIAPISKFHFNNVLLIGDAAHATTPNMGQGACMALEDVAVLYDELKKNSPKEAFQNFEKRRLKRTHYITKTSWKAGKLAQTDNDFIIFLRNNLLRLLPNFISQYPLKRLLEEDFMKV